MLLGARHGRKSGLVRRNTAASLQGGLPKRPQGRYQTKGFSHQKKCWIVCLHSPYCDTIPGSLYYEAFDGGRAGQDAFHLSGTDPVTYKASLWGFQATTMTPEARKERVAGAKSVMS